ncbi:hypothetical protein ACS0TY_013658 [Phlomoides rotata]
MMSPGDKSYSTFELGKKLHEIWNVKGTLNLIPHFRVWVRLLDLPMEYWQSAILEAMAMALGTLIKIDDHTMHKRMGHYARLLVEIDMKNEMIEKIMYKRAGVCSFANIVYEHLLVFCRGCGIVGHTTAECTRGRRQDMDDSKGRGRSTSGPKHTRSSSRRRRSTSRQRDTSIPLGNNPNPRNHELVDDVLYNNTVAMPSFSGDKILALPYIPTKNTFDALSHNDDGSQAHNGDATNTILVHKEDATDSPHL